MQRTLTIVMGSVAVLATTVAAVAGDVDLTASRWFLTGTNNAWVAHLEFDSQVANPNGDDYFLSGHFDWDEGGEPHRETFFGRLAGDSIALYTVEHICVESNCVYKYTAQVGADGDTLENGSWVTGCQDPAPTWMATSNLCRDIVDDGVVNVFDLITLLGDWGPCSLDCPIATTCPSDLNEDDVCDISDLLILLSCWGQLP